MAFGSRPGGTNSAYSSIELMPMRLNTSSTFSPAPSAAVTLPSFSVRALALRPASGPSLAATAALNSLLRIASQVFSTALHVLAVVLDPPATGAGGKRESPTSTLTEPRLSRSAAT